MRVVLLVFALATAASLSLSQDVKYRSKLVQRLRGGSEDDIDLLEEDDLTSLDVDGAESGESPPLPEKRRLTRDEIMQKLNTIPAFCIVNEEGHMVGLQDKEKDAFACCWFTDADEAKALLGATQAANPDKKLRLLVAGLGGAFASCNGFPDGEKALGDLTTGDNDKVEVRLQGTHALVAELKPKLVKLLEAQGMDPGCWQLPVFMCEELQSRGLYPVFLHPADVATVWEKAGRDKDNLPENLTVMDLRMLVQAMANDDSNAWSIVNFIGSTKGAELALEVQNEANEGSAE